MSLFEVYWRALAYLAVARRHVAVICVANVALAMAMIAEPILFGRIIESIADEKGVMTEVAAWAGDERAIVVVVPEFDDYLRPAEARERFASVPGATLIAVDGGKHLWVGETQTRRVLTEIVAAVNPDALPLPTEWDE